MLDTAKGTRQDRNDSGPVDRWPGGRYTRTGRVWRDREVLRGREKGGERERKRAASTKAAHNGENMKRFCPYGQQSGGKQVGRLNGDSKLGTDYMTDGANKDM